MKKVCKTLLATAVVASMSLCVTGCFGAAKELKQLSEQFVEAAIAKEFDDMADLCEDDDDAEIMLSPYDNDFDPVDAILERATYSIGKAEVKKDEGSVVVTITIPDYDSVIGDADDADDFEDALDDADTIDIEVTLEFEKDGDDWVITNLDDFLADFYGEFYSEDFEFESDYEGWVASENWWASDNGTYSSSTSYFDLDLNIASEYYYEDMSYSFRVYDSDGVLVFVKENITDYGFLENYAYFSDSGCAYLDSYPSGTYTFVLYDSNDAEFYRSSCSVR